MIAKSETVTLFAAVGGFVGRLITNLLVELEKLTSSCHERGFVKVPSRTKSISVVDTPEGRTLSIIKCAPRGAIHLNIKTDG
jgi:hypothetical protein